MDPCVIELTRNFIGIPDKASVFWFVVTLVAACCSETACFAIGNPAELWQFYRTTSSRPPLNGVAARLRGGADSVPGENFGSLPSQPPSAKPRRMFAYPWESLGDNDELVDYYTVF
jgi:hypothetical protein